MGVLLSLSLALSLILRTRARTRHALSPPLSQADYYEAVAKAVDPVKKELVACFPADSGLDEACFKIAYDVLIVGVGSVNNTFGIEGVDKYCSYFKVALWAVAVLRCVLLCAVACC